MKTKNILLLVLLLSFYNIFSQNNKEERFKALKNLVNNTGLIIEAELVNQDSAFKGNDRSIYTPYTLKVINVISGSYSSSSIKIALFGGQVGDEIQELAHGFPNFSGRKSIYFFRKEQITKMNVKNNTEVFYTLQMIAPYLGDDKITAQVSLDANYDNPDEFYADLAKIKSIRIPQKKKTVNSEKKNNTQVAPAYNSDNNLLYSQKVLNYNNYYQLISVKAEAVKIKHTPKSPLASDLTLSFGNQKTTGTSPRYFEFDVLASANTNTTYFDNCLIRVQYSANAFGSSIVANNKVIITKGSAFNSTTYIDPNANAIDQTPNTIGIAFGTDFKLSSWNRTLLTTSNQQLLHIKIEIQNCENTGIDFVDQTFTPNFSFYTNTANAPQPLETISYENTYYKNPLNIMLCEVKITDFTSPINGGIGEILEIKGSNFGSVRGNGQVKFRNADVAGFPYIQKINSSDSVLWSDTLIKIKMPSRIDSILNNLDNTPGTGNFIVKNNTNDSAISNLNGSNQPFKVYYSIYSRTIANDQKLKLNLKNQNGKGGYTIQLDTSISNYSERMMCLTKAVKEWRCYTAVNWIIGKDTTMQTSESDGISIIYYSNNISNLRAAETSRSPVHCAASSIAAIKDFDIKINKGFNWFYDTTGLALPAGKIDFYEVILHELGHALGLEHVIDETQVMFYATKYSSTNSIPGSQRKTLKVYTSDVKGGTEQVFSSITNLSGQCNYVDMKPVPAGLCIYTQGINELVENNFYIKTYPNPILGGNLNISFEAPTNLNAFVIIYDVIGKEIYRESVNNRAAPLHTHAINISNLSPGYYFVNLIIGKNKATSKFIKN